MLDVTLHLTVSQLNQHIKDLLDADELLRGLWLEGEVSNFRRSTAGHLYFTLKDAESAIKCAMWRSAAMRLQRLPADGDRVLAYGSVSVYTVQGQYQFYAEQLRPLGAGLLYMRFEELKARLAAEGLFAAERKRRPPAFPRAIGVVTSPSAAAFQDILRVLRARWPMTRVVLAPTLVQGEDAPMQIVGAITALNRHAAALEIDVIIVARGGGSLEELWAFNDEGVARAIAGSEVPVISGVGHEIDFTLADFAADVRAPTPSAAAAAAVPDQVEIRARLAGLRDALASSVQAGLQAARQRLAREEDALRRLSPAQRLQRDRQRLDDLFYRAGLAARSRLALRRASLDSYAGRLAALDPQAVLQRGYAVVRRRDTHELVSRRTQAPAGAPLEIRVSDGSFAARAEEQDAGDSV
jgi:exodeoxyribonuclease VII large subunit